MDLIVAGLLGAAFMLASAAWPRLAGGWLAWPGTAVPVGRLSRLGLGGMWGGVAALLLVGGGGLGGWGDWLPGAAAGGGLAGTGGTPAPRTGRRGPAPVGARPNKVLHPTVPACRASGMRRSPERPRPVSWGVRRRRAVRACGAAVATPDGRRSRLCGGPVRPA